MRGLEDPELAPDKAVQICRAAGVIRPNLKRVELQI